MRHILLEKCFLPEIFSQGSVPFARDSRGYLLCPFRVYIGDKTYSSPPLAELVAQGTTRPGAPPVTVATSSLKDINVAVHHNRISLTPDRLTSLFES
jgi:hypothetical protein